MVISLEEYIDNNFLYRYFLEKLRMRKALEFVAGQVFGYLTVIGRSKNRVGSGAGIRWLCRCVCGKEVAIAGSNLKSGSTKSCGCYKRKCDKKLSDDMTTHGHTASPEYRIWTSLKQRCTNPKSMGYPDYGGRGIAVCERWMESFEAFYQDMGPRPSDLHSIDRKDVNGNYEPGNCRWATNEEQHSNRRNNVFIEYDGRRQTVAQWARESGLHPSTVRHRLKAGWPMERALTRLRA